MSRPVLHTQLGNLAVTRAKLLFIEAMTADPGLSQRELRVGIVLMSCYSTAKGYGAPSLDYVARVIGMNKSSVSRAVDVLERKGYFRVMRASYTHWRTPAQHGIRGHANQYRPNWDKITSVTPLNDAAALRKVAPVQPKQSPLGCKTSEVRLHLDATLPDFSSLNKSCAPQRTSPSARCTRSAAQEEPTDWLGNKGEVGKRLERYEAWLRAGSERRMTAAEVRTARGWLEICDQAAEIHNAHEGDPIGGWAYRLSMELAALLEGYPEKDE
jgi:hypothetical protein